LSADYFEAVAESRGGVFMIFGHIVK
jgi:hypothetical protein